jgi:HEAT repeat protein
MFMKTVDLSEFAIMTLVCVLIGMLLLITVTFIRRWQQVQYSRYGHQLQLQFRPILATLLISGVRSPAAIAALRKLSNADLDLLLDPLFSRRKLSDRQRSYLQNICAELGLIKLWQNRIANTKVRPVKNSSNGSKQNSRRASVPYHLRAKSVRNLGLLGHQPSWAHLAYSLDDPHPDIQLAALRSLATLGSADAFSILRARLHEIVLGQRTTPPMQSLQAAMSRFSLDCVPTLLPSLSHPNRQIRLHSMEVLRMITSREAVRQASFNLNEEKLTAPLTDLLFHRLPVDISDEIRARTAEVIVYLTDPRTPLVLRNLLYDPQWFVRLRTLLALANLRQGAAPLHLDIRLFLRDAHWQMREAAIQALLSIKREDRHELYRFYLSCDEGNIRQQIAEILQRTGVMSALVEEYSSGVRGLPALVVEELAGQSAPAGLWGVLQATAPEIRERFMERFVPRAHSRMLSPEHQRTIIESSYNFQQPLEFPSFSAA